ncbi:hypothetical protein Pan2_08 [Pseudanabaena phage Pan2]|nr:hypothetical protein Pan2_08 [Pseudanabaena phage Pan2]
MATTGVYPPDFTTDTGKVRLLIGDLVATNVSGGSGDYLFFSDDDIDGYLLLSDNIYRVAGFALNGLAAVAADQAESVKDYDIAIDRRQRAEQFREQAKQMFAQAERADAEGDTGFQIVTTGKRYTLEELAEIQVSTLDAVDLIV